MRTLHICAEVRLFSLAKAFFTHGFISQDCVLQPTIALQRNQVASFSRTGHQVTTLTMAWKLWHDAH